MYAHLVCLRCQWFELGWYLRKIYILIHSRGQILCTLLFHLSNLCRWPRDWLVVGLRVFIRAFYGPRNVSRPHEQRNAQVDDGRQGQDSKQTGNLKELCWYPWNHCYFLCLWKQKRVVTRLIYYFSLYFTWFLNILPTDNPNCRSRRTCVPTRCCSWSLTLIRICDSGNTRPTPSQVCSCCVCWGWFTNFTLLRSTIKCVSLAIYFTNTCL